jgi:hypothetical protein
MSSSTPGRSTIDLDDELRPRRREIDDEPPERHLPAKPDAETTAPART